MAHEVDFLAARTKLFAAIDEYVSETQGQGTVATDIIVAVAAVNMHEPNSVTRYMRENRGPMHSVMGLIDFIRTDVRSENDEHYQEGDH